MRYAANGIRNIVAGIRAKLAWRDAAAAAASGGSCVKVAVMRR